MNNISLDYYICVIMDDGG